MAFTQAQLDKLEEAIATGALEVEYGDKRVRYRSMAEMLQARELMARALGKRKKSDRRYAEFHKGLES